MFQFLRSEDTVSDKAYYLKLSPMQNLSVFLFPMLAGLLSGSILGSFTTTNLILQQVLSYFRPGTDDLSFLYSLWHSFRFLICIAILSTSMLGVFLIPLLTLFRGFLLSCSVAAAFQVQAFRGLALGAFSFGVPALFGFPAFLIASVDGWTISRDLAGYAMKRAPHSFGRKDYLPAHLFLIVFLTILEALYTFLLLPLLLKLIP